MSMLVIAAIATIATALCFTTCSCSNLWTREKSSNVFNVKDFGAKGNGRDKDTSAVREAFEAAGKARGGLVLFPGPGQYLTGAFNISSNIVVYVDHNATIQGSADGEDYPLIDPLPWYGGGSDDQQSGKPMHQSLVHSNGANNITITGHGTIDGNGKPWWKCADNLKEAPCSGFSRPHLVMLIGGNTVEISNIEIKNSPCWTLHLAKCSNVHVHAVTFHNPSNAPNADGIDVDCCQNVLVENCSLDVGDDALCVKSGIDWLGRTFGVASENITFRNNKVYHGHGITIGSEMSAGVQNVTFVNITMDGTSNGIRLKSERRRGGVVQNIIYRNISMKHVGTSVDITLNYHHRLHPTNATATPRFENIILEQINSQESHVGFFIDGLPESTIVDLKLIDVDVKAEKMLEACDYVEGSCTNCSYCPKCLSNFESPLSLFYV